MKDINWYYTDTGSNYHKKRDKKKIHSQNKSLLIWGGIKVNIKKRKHEKNINIRY